MEIYLINENFDIPIRIIYFYHKERVCNKIFMILGWYGKLVTILKYFFINMWKDKIWY